jgi:hypothetical protein
MPWRSSPGVPTHLPDTNHNFVPQFAAHGFAGAIKAWLSDNSVTKWHLVTPPPAVHRPDGAEGGPWVLLSLAADSIFGFVAR